MTIGSPQDQDQDLEEFGEQPEPTEDEIIEEHRSRVMYDPDKKSLDFRNLRATDLKDFPRLHLPPTRPQQEELVLATKETIWKQRYCEFMKKYCNQKGRLNMDNMTKAERRSFFKLQKRVRAKEIVVAETDKSGKLRQYYVILEC